MRLVRRVKALKLGDPLDEASDIGTIINVKQFNKVCGYVEEGLNRPEARVVIGALPPKEGPLSEGYYAVPTIFAIVANDWRLVRDENLWSRACCYSLDRRSGCDTHGQ
jgi:acyl-CoA reductase-like NAD-dependent aldehyde dehydrogenase